MNWFPRTCWVMTEGAAGMEGQARALADALGFPNPAVKRVGLRLPWRWLPNHAVFAQLAAAGPGSDPLEPPWPDLLVSCGRKAALLALAVKRASANQTRLVHIQDPRTGLTRYDVLVIPEHDDRRGPNIIVMRGSLHRITPDKMAAASEGVLPLVAHLPRPRIAVLIGGTNRYYRMTPAWIRKFCEQLAAMTREQPCSLMVTPSRRTGADNLSALDAGLQGVPAFLWPGHGSNPYVGFLGLADAVIVSGDSVNMTSEALATGKPVLVARLPGRSRRIDRFFRVLESENLVHTFSGRLELWPNRRIYELPRVAAEVRRRLGLSDPTGGEQLPPPDRTAI